MNNFAKAVKSSIISTFKVTYIVIWDFFPPWFFLSCNANGRIKLAKKGHAPHSSTLVVICVVRLLFLLFYVLFVCKCVLPPGDNPTAVNKYIIYLYNQLDEHFSSLSLYIFRTVFPSIIRSSRLYIQHQAYVIQVSWLLASGKELEPSFQN
jgi:hypothetical protein